LQDQDITINHYFGYPLKVKQIKIDLMPGIDLSYNVSSYDKGSATAIDSTVYKVDRNLYKAPADVSLRLGIAAYYKKFGITASYAHGLINYTSNLIGVTAGGTTAAYIVHSELLRFGITYRIM